MQDGMSYKERQMYLCKTQKAVSSHEKPLTGHDVCDILILLGRSWDGSFLMIGGVFFVKIVVSACLLGRNCKYNGGNNFEPQVADFVRGREVIPVCPEEVLGMPRIPMEIVDGVLINRQGESVDAVVRGQVEKILERLRDEEIECCVLKSRSPTCGVRQVYDGTFSGTLVNGMGVLAQALQEAGYRCIDAEELS